MLSAKERLAQMISKNAIPNSLLLIGPGDGNKEAIILQFAADAIGASKSEKQRILNGIHPDVHLYHPEGKLGMHSLQSLRSLADSVALPPLESSLQFFILLEADRMLPTSANALLKTFEEPTPHSIIILLSSHPEKILPTILSRCQTLYIHSDTSIKITPLVDSFLDFLAGKKKLDQLDELITMIENEKKGIEEKVKEDSSSFEKQTEGHLALFYQEKTSLLLSAVMMWYRDLYALKSSALDYLFFPQKIEDLKSATSLPINKVEKIVKEARLAMDRSMKLSVCLEALLIQLSLLQKAL